MRLPFPERLRLWQVFVFACVLAGVQLLEHTSPFFILCGFTFTMISTVAFNIAGGFTRPSGAYIFFFAFLGVILGMIVKAFLGEPGNSNLYVPNTTMAIYVASSFGLLGSIFLSRKFTKGKAYLEDFVPSTDLSKAALGCLVFGASIQISHYVFPNASGSIVSALSQLNRFVTMATVLATVDEIRKSGGRRSVNWIVIVSSAITFFFGIIGYSKEGIFTPALVWLIAAASCRYRFSWTQIGTIGAAFFLMSYYLVPYAQYGRNYHTDQSESAYTLGTSYYLLTHLNMVRTEALRYDTTDDYTNSFQHYFNSPQGLFDRLQMISVDDSLNDLTDRGTVFGISPTIASLANIVPHFLWHDKPELAVGNAYAHEIGGLSEDDFTTGISFTPSADAYHQAKWVGVFLLAPIHWFVLFVVYDYVCGDVRKSPWGLIAIATFSHAAPESMLNGIVTQVWIGTIGILLIAFAAAYVLPLFGSLLTGPARVRIKAAPQVGSIPARAIPLRRAVASNE